MKAYSTCATSPILGTLAAITTLDARTSYTPNIGQRVVSNLASYWDKAHYIAQRVYTATAVFNRRELEIVPDKSG